MDNILIFTVWSVLFKVFKMIIEFDGDKYESIIGEEIGEGDFYYDSIEQKIKICDQYICFIPWGVKVNKIIEGEGD